MGIRSFHGDRPEKTCPKALISTDKKFHNPTTDILKADFAFKKCPFLQKAQRRNLAPDVTFKALFSQCSRLHMGAISVLVVAFYEETLIR